MLNWSQCSAVECVPGKVSGAWTFRGTGIPVKALFENLEDGATVSQFLEWFPGMTKEQVEAVLEFASQSLVVAEPTSAGMKILFVQGTPAPLRRSLGGHIIVMAFGRGWSNLQDGDLIQAAEAEGFQALITTDQNLKYQQNLSDRKLAILVLPTTSWPKIQNHRDKVYAAVSSLKPGDYRELDFGN